MAAKKSKPWKGKNPAKAHRKLSAAQRGSARKSARKAGRSYPNLVDNMNAAKKAKRRGSK